MSIGLSHKLENYDDWCFFKIDKSICLRLENSNLYSYNKEIPYRTRPDYKGEQKTIDIPNDKHIIEVFYDQKKGQMWFVINDVLGEVINDIKLRSGEWMPTFCMGSKDQMFSFDTEQ